MSWFGGRPQRVLVGAAVLAAVMSASSALPAMANQDRTTTYVPVRHAVSELAEQAKSPSGAHCRDFQFLVAQREGEPVDKKIFGQLCSRDTLSADTPVQVLVHGGSYDHAYWDWPYQPERYSYVAAATKAGYGTLNIDRLGNGRSDHPLPVTLDFNVAGFVTHQLVQYLRAGAVGPKFTKVILNGHSMGGLTVEHEASRYHDVDAVILTGVAHNIAAAGLAHVADKFYPAALDPKFFGLTLPPGYLTTFPGDRAKTFIEPGRYDPRIEPVEEAHKDVLSPTELTAISAESFDPAITRAIQAPVLFALGQHDLIWCARTGDCNTDPQARAEKNYYAVATSFTPFVVPDAGHSVNMCLSAPIFYRETFRWLAQRGLD